MDNPAAWITTAARRLAVDAIRRARTASRALPALAAAAREVGDPVDVFAFNGDERLELILTVCHPEVAEETRLALALRFACGVPTRDVATMLLIAETTMAARLTRAKKHLHDSPIRFALADVRQVSERMPDALSVIALMYTVGYAAPTHEDAARLRADAIALARDAHRVGVGGSETSGLLALLLLTEARSASRVDATGEMVELATADRTLWDRRMLEEGESLATSALTSGTGRFALQAGIAGIHALAPSWEETDWDGIARLYEGLVDLWPSPPARLARIVARGYSSAVGAANARLELDADDELFSGATAAQAFAVRAELDILSGERASARDDLRASAARTADPVVRRHLERRIASLGD
ncbi:RNA polymerase sigma factor [Microbacterium sp. NPDC057944]|uniref:RNA polymerase sigma factor n=1 Tax=Microbacterium sp. NPDC057944 TaxID=3346286 RepID=UPI0036DAB08F